MKIEAIKMYIDMKMLANFDVASILMFLMCVVWTWNSESSKMWSSLNRTVKMGICTWNNAKSTLTWQSYIENKTHSYVVKCHRKMFRLLRFTANFFFIWVLTCWQPRVGNNQVCELLSFILTCRMNSRWRVRLPKT